MGVGETLLDKMKAYVCLLFCLHVPYVLSAAAGNDEGRKKRSADGYSNNYSTYYGAGPSAQYQTFGFGMAGQQPFHGKMRYVDPLSGERYKAWLAGQAMYGFRMRPMSPYLNRNHGYLQTLLQNGMYNQYQALRTPSNSLWKQYGFSLYGNAGNGKYTVPGQTRRKKRSTYGGYDNSGYGYNSYGNSGYGSGGYGNNYGGSGYGGYGDNYGSYGSGSDYSSGYGNNDYGGYGNNYGGSGYGNNYDSGYGYGNNYGDSGYGYGNNYGDSGYGDNYGGGYGGSGYNDGGYGDNYGGYSGGGYGGGGYNDGGYGSGYGDNYGGYGGGYSGGGYHRKKRSLYSPMIHGVKGYYGKGFQALANFAAKGPWTYGGASGWGGYP